MNHKCWKVPSFDDLLRFLEKTDQLCDLDPSLHEDITTDNEHLVLADMPFPPKFRDELCNYVCGKVIHKQVDFLWKAKEYFEKKKSGQLGLDFKSKDEKSVSVGKPVEKKKHVEADDVRKPVVKKKHVKADDDEELVEKKKHMKDGNKKSVNKKKHVKNMYEEKVAEESELLDIRQIIYLKLSQGLYMDAIMRAFKFKVEQYLKKYRRSLSYHQEKIWRDKIVITEKAINRYKREFENKLKGPAKEVVEINPVVEEMIDAAQAVAVAPEPPVEEMVKSKKSYEKRLDKEKNQRKRKAGNKIAESESKMVNNGTKKVAKRRFKAVNINVENVDEISKDEYDVKVKDDNSLYKKDELEVKEAKVFVKNLDKIAVSDDENLEKEKLIEDENVEKNRDDIDVEGHSIKIAENESKVMEGRLDTDENAEKETVDFNGRDYSVNDERLYPNIYSNQEKISVLPLLQANLAAMLLCVKTIQEQSAQLARFSDLFWSSSMSIPYQPTASSTRAHSSCLTQSRKCSKETKAITGIRKVSMASTDTGNVKRLIAKFDTGGTFKD